MDNDTRLVRKAARQLIRNAFRDCGVECRSTDSGIMSITYAHGPIRCTKYTGQITVAVNVNNQSLTYTVGETIKGHLALTDPSCFQQLLEIIRTSISETNKRPKHYLAIVMRTYYESLLPQYIADGDEVGRPAPGFDRATVFVRKPPTRFEKILTKFALWLIWRFDLRYFEKKEIEEAPKPFFVSQAIQRFCLVSEQDVQSIMELADNLAKEKWQSLKRIQAETEEIKQYDYNRQTPNR